MTVEGGILLPVLRINGRKRSPTHVRKWRRKEKRRNLEDKSRGPRLEEKTCWGLTPSNINTNGGRCV